MTRLGAWPGQHLPGHSPSPHVVRILSPAPRDLWRRLLDTDPDGVVTQAPEWLDCVCKVGGYVDASRLYECADGRTLLLPLVGRVWAGTRLAEESWPYGWGYGGVLVSGGRLSVRDAEAVLTDLGRRPIIRAGVVPMPLASLTWQKAAPSGVRRVPYLSHILDLEGGFATVWRRRYRNEVRRHVRRAGRMSLDVHLDHRRGVDAFAALYPNAVERWARQRGQPLWAAHVLARRRNNVGRLTTAATALGDQCAIWSAYRAGEPIAVCAVLHRGAHAIAWLAASNRDLSRETGATYLLSSTAIEAACATGARYFHFGESDPGSGVEHHKLQFGVTPLEYQALRFERLPLTEGERRLRAVASHVSLRRTDGG